MSMFDGELSAQAPVLVERMRPDQVGVHWDKMKAGLEKLRRLGAEDWRPEDLYHALKTGNSSALINTQHWDGFIVYTTLPDFVGATLWIWIAYAERGADVDAYWSEIKRIARESGVTKICFSSARIGWARAAKKRGFRATRIMYQLDEV